MLVGILEGLPAGVPVDLAVIDRDLSRRMSGHGRGKRMKIEADRVRVVAGVRFGETLGSPIAWLIDNRDWPNWRSVMAVESADVDAAAAAVGAGEGGASEAATATGAGAVGESGNRPARADARAVTRPRPGHADLAGGIKYDRADLRDVLERASARETASRVAAGGFCRLFLRHFGVEIVSHVLRIGGVGLPLDDTELPFDTILARVEDSPVRCVDDTATAAMLEAIDRAHDRLDTLGGCFEVVARGLPVGLGSHVQWDRRLEGRIAQAMLSIQAQKGVEVGPARWVSEQPGSRAHDAILPGEAGLVRPTNRAGGTEGGMSYGGELRVRVFMKPLATLRRPLPSVDLRTGEAVEAVVQRSDVCAVPAAGVVGEAMLALVLADAFLEKFGGDSLRETRRNWQGYLQQSRRPPGT